MNALCGICPVVVLDTASSEFCSYFDAMDREIIAGFRAACGLPPDIANGPVIGVDFGADPPTVIVKGSS